MKSTETKQRINKLIKYLRRARNIEKLSAHFSFNEGAEDEANMCKEG